MIEKRVLGAAVVAVAIVLQRVIIFYNRTLPTLAFDAKVVIATTSKIALSGIAL